MEEGPEEAIGVGVVADKLPFGGVDVGVDGADLAGHRVNVVEQLHDEPTVTTPPLDSGLVQTKEPSLEISAMGYPISVSESAVSCQSVKFPPVA